jgi:hypothetical protein
VYFSGKISNAVLTFLDQQGVNLEGVYDLTDLPMEFLRDPSAWVDAEKLESFLRKLDDLYGAPYKATLLEEVGKKSHELRAWGVLDSVLKIMQNPHDIYLQPERFISYFISPAPPLADVTKGKNTVSFELPIFAEEYPCNSLYMKSALESLPEYIGRQPATISWNNNFVQINWSENQGTLWDESDLGSNMRPELVRNMASNLEIYQKDLEKRNEELAFKDQEIERLRIDINNLLRTPIAGRKYSGADSGDIPAQVDKHLFEIKNHLFLMNDYLSRAQQLITLLVGLGQNEAQVKMAMRRVGWDQVMASRSQLARLTLDHIDQLKLKLAQSQDTKANDLSTTENKNFLNHQ